MHAKTKHDHPPTNIPAGWNWLRTPLSVAGLLLITSGLLHFGIWIQSDSSWSGEVSWRKPTLFGISGGVTLVSIAALMPRLSSRRRDPYLAISLSIAMVLEVGLISLQQWRGVASHFNEATPFDAGVEWAITILICIVTISLLDLGLRSFGPMTGTSDSKLAWRGGIAFLLVSCGIGFVILAYGHAQSAAGQDPTIYGASGVVKFPHGMTIHALQFFPAVAWFLAITRVPESDRQRVICSLIVSMSLLLVYSILQTLAGRDRGDMTAFSMSLLILALLFTLPLAHWAWRLSMMRIVARR